ncbi:Uncharacterized lactate 2-monooxygenase [Sparassis crispa]|uniref:Uncharacterized lactate 2-monooxygenase n=1 Tax=Sparassis crispa TaxID=139825 RepID=A0A401GUB0_9APHY|nr:Uncharacterized lactate 2-monooxygenase [Sparassis crispa]GBE85773.1 Uncharacterized lactate 2-monooxygenase [Sparassis crispa]
MTEPAPIPEAGVVVVVPQRWSGYAGELYSSRLPPPALGTVKFAELEEKARQVLKDDVAAFQYVSSGAGTYQTLNDNIRAFERWKIVPQMLIDTAMRDLETTIFGVKLPCPLFISPMGAQGLVHPEGELATARAAGKLHVPMVLSTPSTRSLESVAQANGPNSVRWFQLYWPRSDEITLSLLARAKANGFSALVVTLDTNINGWRTHDLSRAYAPAIHGVGAQNLMSDPVFMARHGLEPIHYQPAFPYNAAAIDQGVREGDELAKRDMKLGVAYVQEVHSGECRTWEDLRFIRDNWKGPLVLKGIQTVRDAEKAIEVGANGIVVSNHGGRQIDGALPSIYALETICKAPSIREAQRSGKLTVLFDSGIRNGTHVFKALALGAQAVLLARPILFGLAVGGQAGVEEVLRSVLAELEISMGLAGYSKVSEFQGAGEEVVTKVDYL